MKGVDDANAHCTTRTFLRIRNSVHPMSCCTVPEWKGGGGGAGLFESVASYAKAGFIVHAQPQACLDHDDTAP